MMPGSDKLGHLVARWGPKCSHMTDKSVKAENGPGHSRGWGWGGLAALASSAVGKMAMVPGWNLSPAVPEWCQKGQERPLQDTEIWAGPEPLATAGSLLLSLAYETPKALGSLLPRVQQECLDPPLGTSVLPDPDLNPTTPGCPRQPSAFPSLLLPQRGCVLWS